MSPRLRGWFDSLRWRLEMLKLRFENLKCSFQEWKWRWKCRLEDLKGRIQEWSAWHWFAFILSLIIGGFLVGPAWPHVCEWAGVAWAFMLKRLLPDAEGWRGLGVLALCIVGWILIVMTCVGALRLLASGWGKILRRIDSKLGNRASESFAAVAWLIACVVAIVFSLQHSIQTIRLVLGPEAKAHVVEFYEVEYDEGGSGTVAEYEFLVDGLKFKGETMREDVKLVGDSIVVKYDSTDPRQNLRKGDWSMVKWNALVLTACGLFCYFVGTTYLPEIIKLFQADSMQAAADAAVRVSALRLENSKMKQAADERIKMLEAELLRRKAAPSAAPDARNFTKRLP